jgi:hypothetical protein
MKTPITIIIGVLITSILAISLLYAYLTDEVVTITITDKERIVTGSGDTLSSKFLIYADGEVFQNTDSLWYWKWNSADVQNELKVGQEYTVKVYGWRVPFLSMFRNVVEVNNN